MGYFEGEKERLVSHQHVPSFVRPMPALRAVFAAAGIVLATFAGTAFLPAPAAAQYDEGYADLVEKLSPAVVNISTVQTVKAQAQRSPFPPGSPFEEFFEEFFGQRPPAPDTPDGRQGQQQEPQRRLQSLGSGFIIDASGYVVTNNHVVAEADEITVRTVDGEEYTAELVGTDQEVDIALLKITGDKPFPFVAWGDSDRARVGNRVLAIGNPFGLGGSVTAGIISARHRQISGNAYDDFLQTDASINRGNSGGPMFNLDGQVVGVNSAIFSPTGGNVGIGFSIPSNQVRRVVEQIREFGYARRGFLGVNIQAVDKMTAEALGLEEPRGALVAAVTPDSPADKAGIKAYDIIVEFDGKKIEDSGALVRIVGNFGVGETAKIVLLRNGKRQTVSVTTTEKPRPDAPVVASASAAPAEVESLGVTFTALTPAMREQLEVPADVNGVLVTDVNRDLAQRLTRGDIITEIDRLPVDSVEAITGKIAALREAGKSAVLLRVYRDGAQYFIPVPIKDAG